MHSRSSSISIQSGIPPGQTASRPDCSPSDAAAKPDEPEPSPGIVQVDNPGQPDTLWQRRRTTNAADMAELVVPSVPLPPALPVMSHLNDSNDSCGKPFVVDKHIHRLAIRE